MGYGKEEEKRYWGSDTEWGVEVGKQERKKRRRTAPEEFPSLPAGKDSIPGKSIRPQTPSPKDGNRQHQNKYLHLWMLFKNNFQFKMNGHF